MFGLSERIVIGYDLSDEYAQISYCHLNDENVTTLSLVEGEEQYNIPACLFKRSEVNHWFFGKEAKAYETVEEGTMINHLLEQAYIGEQVNVLDEMFDPIALLALFIKRSLSLLGNEFTKGKMEGIMFSVPKLTKRAITVLNQVGVLLDLKDTKIFFQGREESIYHYLIHQPRELWNYAVEVYDFSENQLKSYHFYDNKHTSPIVTFIDETVHEDALLGADELDDIFLEVVTETTEGRIVSCAYLIGDGFAGDWCKNSLRALCWNRRVFRGNNLYSKGACYTIQSKLTSEGENKSRIFLGKDKLKANIGMNVVRKQEESYLALLNGGENWYDSKKECDIILVSGNTFSIIITPLDGRNVKSVEVELQGLPEREDKTTRLRLQVVMETENILKLSATDMGFGEFVPSTGQVFTQQITLL